MMTAISSTPDVLSFADKLELAYWLALELCYDGEQPRDTTALYGEDVSDELWGYVDGLTHGYHIKRQTGRCSLQAMMNQKGAKCS